jgi:translation initiation factor IF-2
LPIRIYALAKQLNLDSKVLVDICTKAGITGKGSALASLTDEEYATVKEFMAGGRKSPAIGVGAPVRPVTAPAAEPAATAATTAMRRPEYAGPGGLSSGKVPVLSAKAGPSALAKKKAGDEGDTAAARPPEKTGPSIKLAPMPAMQAPPAQPKVEEPVPQKPDIKLPLDAIRASKAGEKPLSEHMKKTEEKRQGPKRGAPRAPAPGEPPTTAAAAAARERERERPRRKGAVAATPAVEEEEGASTLGGREARQLKRKRVTSKPATAPRGADEEEPVVVAPRRPQRIRRTGTNTAAPRKTNVVLDLPCTVREFSESVGVPARTVLGKLLAMGAVNTNINAELSAETVELLAVELGVEVVVRRHVALEDKVLASLDREDPPESLQPRAPVVTFLGHVDHGKTSLLDRIIGIDVASGEKGGITQHIRAYRVTKDDRAIAFVDTPGHEAFTEMRARGANVTDIAVLVVAADDGVMPQTEEAISHARAAGVPIVVALNKIDLPGVNMPRILQQLAANELLPSEWGGDVEVVQTSAVKGTGIDKLLETLLTVAELREFKANPDRPAAGTCLEAELHEGRGAVVKLLVQKGTLHVGDVVLCGAAYGRVKAMYDTLSPRKRYETAGPSTPVNVTGLNVAPAAGDRFYVLDDVSQARQMAEQRAAHSRQEELAGTRTHVTLENLFDQLGHEENVRTLHIILRADVRGSIEAIRKELGKLEHPEVQIQILQATVGGITEADVHLADASDAVIIGFNVVPDEQARVLAEQRGVQIRRYDIIYQVTEDLRAALEGMLKPEKRVSELGRVLVQRAYHISRVGTVAGCRVLSGTIQRDSRMRVIRESRVIGEYALGSLKREKDDVREVREGMECGIKLAGFNDVKEGDVLENFRIDEVRRTF